jgi:hypothetical protein
MKIEIKELITLLGISVSLIIGLFSIYIGFKNSKKTIFINSVTASRTKWIETVRNMIAEFCSLVPLIPLDSSTEQDNKMYKLHQLMFLIKLQLNRNDTFDLEIINLVDSIYSSMFKCEEMEDSEKNGQINKLIELTQDLLKLEWEGIKEETKKGNLSKREKRKLYRRNLKTLQK